MRHLIILVIGGFLCMGFMGGLISEGWQGPLTAGLFGLMVSVPTLMVISGVRGLMGKEPMTGKAWLQGLLLIAAVLAITGPMLSSSSHRSTERDMWSKTKDSTRMGDWREYERKVPRHFRRPEYNPGLMRAEAVWAAAGRNVGELRAIIQKVNDEHKGDAAYAPALAEAQKGLAKLYQDALAKLDKPGKGLAGQLQAAFVKIINDLSTRNDARIYLEFTNSAVVEPPKGHEEYLAEMRADSSVMKTFPKKDAPVVPPGDAFTKAFDLKRRDTFIAAFQESIKQVFSGGLLEIVPLTDKAQRQGNYVFIVDSAIVRTPDYYQQTRGAEKRTIGLLFGIGVQWKFLILDREGKLLFDAKTRSSPAEEVSFRVKPDDPAWAPYSIMMDSAYYNYARQIIEAFGLEAPAQKRVFEFTK